MEFLFAPENTLFVIAIFVIVGMVLLEGAGTLIGASISGYLDSLSADLDTSIDLDAVSPDAQGSLSKLLAWLRFGKVPVLILLVIFLAAFGLFGLLLQYFVSTFFGGALLPGALAMVPAFAGALPVVRVLGGLLAEVLPTDESSAVSDQSFIGSLVTITGGTARHGLPAEAKLVDRYGKTHYLMVAPDEQEVAFSPGSTVLIVRKEGSIFRVTEASDQLTRLT